MNTVAGLHARISEPERGMERVAELHDIQFAWHVPQSDEEGLRAYHVPIVRTCDHGVDVVSPGFRSKVAVRSVWVEPAMCAVRRADASARSAAHGGM